MPVGALAVLSVQRTMNSGLKAGFIIGLAAAISDLLYASIAAFGLKFLSDFFMNHKITLSIIGGIIIIFMGVKIYLSDTIKQYRRKNKLTKTDMANDFLSSLMIALSNPITILGFGTFFASFGVASIAKTHLELLLLIAFIFIGAISWWFGLSFAIDRFRNRITLRILVWINRITGVAVIVLGVAILLSAFFLEK